MKVSKVAIVGALVLGVAACGSPNAPDQTKVSGNRDDVKKVEAVKEKSHKVKKTKQVCSRKVAGKCKSYKTVADGTRKVVDRKAKPALYCVEVDNVNGSAQNDDAWYATTGTTYLKALALEEGDAIKFKALHTGCW